MPRLDYHGTVPAAPQPLGEGLRQDWALVLLHEINLLRQAAGLPERTLSDLVETLGQRRAHRSAARESTA